MRSTTHLTTPALKRAQSWLNKIKQPHLAIFDVGTRAVRLLIAPKMVPNDWNRDLFCNDSNIHNIGEFISRQTGLVDADSRPVQVIRHFISEHVLQLRSAGVREIYCIGTAAFRWLGPQRDVLDLKNLVGINLDIIERDREGLYTLLAIPEILVRTKALCNFANDDVIVMIDQGGGSLDVSWMPWEDRHSKFPKVKVENFDNLGTVALRRDFFSLDASAKAVEPTLNKTRVAAQVERIQRDASRALAAWGEFGAHFHGRRRRVYVIGSAPTNMFHRSGTQNVHGKSISLDRIDAFLNTNNGVFDQNKQQVLSIYKALNRMKGAGTEGLPNPQELDRVLTKIYGLPVYSEVMKKFGVRDASVFGYGLRYGYYLWKTTKEVSGVDDYLVDSTGPFAFISYAHVDRSVVYPYLHELRKNGLRFWYDRGLAGGENYAARLVSRIRESRVLLFFATSASVESDSVATEIAIARESNIKIVPVKLNDVPWSDELAWHLSRMQVIRAYDLNENSLMKQIRASLPDDVWN